MFDLNFNMDVFYSKSDEELAVAARSNNAAATLLVSRYSKLIFIKSEIYANYNTDSDDLSQEGLVGLLHAISSYDLDKGAKFATFAEVCIVNSMKSLLAKGRNVAAPVENIYELTESKDSIADETPESIYLYKEYFSELLSNIHSILSPAEYKIFNLCVQGLSYKNVAEELGITEKSVDNAMQRARKKIRALL